MSNRNLFTLVLLANICLAPLRADDTFGPVRILIDTPTDFRAVGTLSSWDTTNPPNGVNDANALLVGAHTLLPGATPTHWWFMIAHRNNADTPYNPPQRMSPGGFHDAALAIVGMHQRPPHAGEGPNFLPLKRGDSAQVEFRWKEGKDLSAGKAQAHPGAGRVPHWDHYIVRSKVSAQSGPPHMLGGVVEIIAHHGDKESYTFDQRQGMGSSSRGSYVSYDANTRLLSLTIGPIDILDVAAGRTGAVDSRYVNDPLLSARWSATPLRFLGQDQSGLFLFSGGTVTVRDAAASSFAATGSFAQYTIRNTTEQSEIGSFALLDSLTISDDGRSGFLNDFPVRSASGEGLAEAEQARCQGIVFSFITDVDLVQATRGFSQSVHNLPATFILAAAVGAE